jgi:hypothetical protein
VQLVERDVQYIYEEEVQSSASQFGEVPCLAYCPTCKQRALTVIRLHKTWMSQCFLWLRCLAPPQEGVHLCRLCSEQLGRVNGN